MNRETLEALALEAVSAELYYELLDCISEISDNELEHIAGIAEPCMGDFDENGDAKPYSVKL